MRSDQLGFRRPTRWDRHHGVAHVGGIDAAQRGRHASRPLRVARAGAVTVEIRGCDDDEHEDEPTAPLRSAVGTAARPAPPARRPHQVRQVTTRQHKALNCFDRASR